MNDDKMINTERGFWLIMKQRMAMAESEIPVTRERVQHLQSQLPDREPDENVGNWIRRVSQLSKTGNNTATAEDKHVTKRELQCLAHIVRFAADPGEIAYPLPDPGWIYESEDGRWRLKILAEQDCIQLVFQALSYAVDELAGHKIVFWDEASNQPFASIKLDDDGDGICQLQNTLANRKALCQPYILIEEI